MKARKVIFRTLYVLLLILSTVLITVVVYKNYFLEEINSNSNSNGNSSLNQEVVTNPPVSEELKKEYVVEDYVQISPYPISQEYKARHFSNYTLKKVSFRGLNSEVVTDFIEKQQMVGQVIEINEEDNGKREAVSEISSEIYDGILSVRVFDNVETIGYPAHTYLYLNVDLAKNEKVTNTQLINKYGYSKEKLAKAMVNSLTVWSHGVSKNGVDVSKSDFMSKYLEFENFVLNNIDTFDIYIKDKELYLDNNSLNLLTKLGYSYPTGGPQSIQIIKLEK